MIMDDIKTQAMGGASVQDCMDAYESWVNERRDGSPETIAALAATKAELMSWLTEQAIEHRTAADEADGSEQAVSGRALATRLSDLREAIKSVP